MGPGRCLEWARRLPHPGEGCPQKNLYRTFGTVQMIQQEPFQTLSQIFQFGKIPPFCWQKMENVLPSPTVERTLM